MTVLTFVPLVVVALIVGVLIGCVGIGGVLLVPSLTYIGGMDIHVAVATCMLSYFFSGIVGAVSFAKRGSIRWSMSGWLCVGAMPGAFLGAATVSAASGVTLEIIIAGLIVLSGIHALGQRVSVERAAARLKPAQLISVGGLTGYGSALSGTGGPLLLVPALLWLEVPVLTAVGLSQVIQVPIATLATVGNWLYGSIDLWVGLGLAVLLMAGVAVGARLAHWVSAAILKRIVAVALLAVGALIIARISGELVRNAS